MKRSVDILAPVMKLAGEKETGTGNNTTVNKYFGAIGSPYCGFTEWYGDKVSGCGVFNGCSNPAYCPTLNTFLSGKGWKLRDNTRAQRGDIFIVRTYDKEKKHYVDQHTGFIFEQISGVTFITLEGNSMVYATEQEAKNSTVGSGAFEGIGYKKRYMPTGESYYIFHPPYSDAKTDLQKTCNVILPQLDKDPDVFKIEVQALQDMLNARGYSCGSADGYFGTKTEAAVKSIQSKNSLTADGVVGALTWPVIMKTPITRK